MGGLRTKGDEVPEHVGVLRERGSCRVKAVLGGGDRDHAE